MLLCSLAQSTGRHVVRIANGRIAAQVAVDLCVEYAQLRLRVDVREVRRCAVIDRGLNLFEPEVETRSALVLLGVTDG